MHKYICDFSFFYVVIYFHLHWYVFVNLSACICKLNIFVNCSVRICESVCLHL